MKPLAGVRVVDFTAAMAGPFATMLLADLGAEVIKVEPPDGDHARDWGPPFYGEKYSAYFTSINRGKKSIALDLKKPEARDAVYRLVKTSRVVVENFRPGVAQRLGIDYETLKKINPDIVYCSISGFGEGPHRDLPAYDLVALAMSGLMDLTGEPDRPPVKFAVPITDITAGFYCALYVTAAVLTNRPGYIEVPLIEAAISLLTHQAAYYFASGEPPRRMGSAHLQIAPYQVFKAKDGYVVLAVGSDHLWKKFCEAIGRPELAEDPRFKTNQDRVKNREELVRIIEEILATGEVSHWVSLMWKHGVAAAPVYNVAQVFQDPHVRHRKIVIDVESPHGTLKIIRAPVVTNALEVGNYAPPPLLGQHTYEILKELGYADEEIEKLVKSGAALGKI
ncbi:MAG: CaiB/BaiF CoA-transferase family protein [Pyrobaculum sp.]